ncbi:MAG: hypothetical protein GEU73_16585 [Chloroflexi bacterium]|nr:hypothetical protein [Chloroflexota bacterium]
MAAIDQVTRIRVTVTEELLPRGHESHGTPDPVRKRIFLFGFPDGDAEIHQTDYGHPGRMNPCYPQKVPPRLQPRTPQILAAAEALARLM